MLKTMQVVGVSLDSHVTPTLMDCIHIQLGVVYHARSIKFKFSNSVTIQTRYHFDTLMCHQSVNKVHRFNELFWGFACLILSKHKLICPMTTW